MSVISDKSGWLISSFSKWFAISFAHAHVRSSAYARSSKQINPNLKATKQSSLNFLASFHNSIISDKSSFLSLRFFSWLRVSIRFVMINDCFFWSDTLIWELTWLVPKILKIKTEQWLIIALPLSEIMIGCWILFTSHESFTVATTSFA